MGSPCQVVITGVGVACPIGIGAGEFWKSLADGRSGVRRLPFLEDTPWPVKIGAPVSDFDPKQYVKPRKSLKVMSREIQIGFTAAALAIEDSGLAVDAVDPDRIGVVYGSQMLYCEPQELEEVYRGCVEDGRFDFEPWGEMAMNAIFPLWLLKYLPNMPACHIAIAHDARGPNNTITQGDSSSLRAIAEAAHIIGRGQADVVIAGGTSNRLSLTPMMYRGDLAQSHRADDPAAASRPFDADRDGMVNGEGAGALVLESREHAAGRGAKVLATVLGWGEAYEWRWKSPPPTGDGYRLVIRQALQRAGLSAEELDHVNAHGLSTVDDDRLEALAIRDCLGDVPVTAPKSFFGNLGASGAAVELAASVLALAHQQVPFTLNYQKPDPACPVNVIRSEFKPVTKDAALKLSQSGTGQTVALVLGRQG